MTSDSSVDVPALPESAPRLHRGWWIAFWILAIGLTSIAVEEVFHFVDSPIDGPFQLFNALRRLTSGQRFGGSFQFFHGPGIPYLHLIPFVIFGRGFIASEMTRQVLSIVTALAVTVAFFLAWTRSWRSAIPLTVAALVTMVVLRVNALLYPINSMLGLRSTMPLLFGMHLLLRVPGWRTTVERAALLALALAFGVEQGMATIAAFIAIQGLVALRRRELAAAVHAAASVAGAVVLFVGIVAAMSPHEFRSVLAFNFKLLPRDQFWYFGAPPNPFLADWTQLLTFIARPGWLLVIAPPAIWTLRRFWRGVTQDDSREPVAEAFLIIYAAFSAASMLGTFVLVYLQPAVRVCLFLLLINLRREWLARQESIKIPLERKQRFPALAVVLVAVLGLVSRPLATISIIRMPLHTVFAHAILRDGPRVSADWDSTGAIGLATIVSEANRLGHKPALWSTYAGLLEWKTDQFHPYFDYIIHALGHENRAEYGRRFVAAHPDVVQTLQPGYGKYEEWLETNSWDFYHPLLRDYVVASGGPWSFFWLRRHDTFDESPHVVANTAIPPGQLAIAIDAPGQADSISLFEVRLRYHVSNPLGKIPVVGSLPRYLVLIDGTANRNALSLAPYEVERTFPVVTVGPPQIRLRGTVRSLIGGASLSLDSIRVVRLRIAPENRRWAEDFVYRLRDTTPKAPR